MTRREPHPLLTLLKLDRADGAGLYSVVNCVAAD